MINDHGDFVWVKYMSSVHFAESINGHAAGAVLAQAKVQVGNDNVGGRGVFAAVRAQNFFGDGFRHNV